MKTIHVINILYKKKWQKDWEKKENIKLILIESIPGNRSDEHAQFIYAIEIPLASVDIKVCARACVICCSE